MDVRNEKLAQIQYTAARHCLEQGAYIFAIRNYDMVIEMDPDYAEAYLDRGISNFIWKDYGRAILDFIQFLKLKPMNADVFLQLVKNCFISIKYDGETADFFTTIAQLKAHHYNDRGIFYFHLQMYDNAIVDYTSYLKGNPFGSSIVYANRGLARHRNQQYELSLADYKKAIALSPSNVKAHIFRGELYADLKQYDTALADMSKAVELDPASKENISNLEELLIDIFKLDDLSGINTSSLFLVLDVIGKITSEKQKDFLGLLNKIYVRMKTDNSDAVVENIFGSKSVNLEESMEKFLAIQKKHKINFYNKPISTNRAEGYFKEGLFTCAIEDCTRIILLGDKCGLAHNCRGYTYNVIGMLDLAIADFDIAIKLGHLGAYVNRGHARFKLNQHDLALADLSKGVEVIPGANSYNNRGYLYFTQGNFKLAIADYVKALSFNVEHDYANKYLEEIFDCVRTKDDIGGIGISSLELVFEIVPKFPEDEQRSWLVMLKELNMRIKAINSSLGFSILNQYKLSRAGTLEENIVKFIGKIDSVPVRQVNVDNSDSDEEKDERRDFSPL